MAANHDALTALTAIPPDWPRFKCRAESVTDIWRAHAALTKHNHAGSTGQYLIHISANGSGTLPDCDWVFCSNIPLGTIKAVLEQEADLHVMAQTLQPLHLYTGDRI